MIPLYLLCVVIPYNLRASFGHYDYAVGWGAVFVSVWHIALATWAAYKALPGKSERLALAACIILPWVVAALVAFATAPVGQYRRFVFEYVTLTGSTLAGGISCFGAAALAIWRKGKHVV